LPTSKGRDRKGERKEREKRRKEGREGRRGRAREKCEAYARNAAAPTQFTKYMAAFRLSRKIVTVKEHFELKNCATIAKFIANNLLNPEFLLLVMQYTTLLIL